MPKHLRYLARFANMGIIGFALIGAFGILFRGNVGGFLFFLLLAAVMSFNLYLIEKSAMLLSEEEWLKSEVRKVFLRRQLQRLSAEDQAKDGPS